MELKIGDRIREMRKKAGRTQEEMASVLGVTPQAVSKWESMNGYPDMETIPALANYFGVTIDALFGYDGERERRVKEICDRADRMLNMQEEIEECVAVLREAVQEFPANADLLVRLGYALHYLGWKIYGAVCYSDQDHPNGVPDTKYHRKNQYWTEAAAIFERTLDMNLSVPDRETVIPILLNIYSERGETDKAERLALLSPSLRNGRVVLKTMVWDENVLKSHGECILTLLDVLRSQMISALASNGRKITNEYKVRMIEALIHLYEEVIPDGNDLSCHCDLYELYLWLVIFRLWMDKDDITPALDAYQKMIAHYEAYDALKGQGMLKYTAPLLSEVEYDASSLVSAGLTTAFESLENYFQDDFLVRPKAFWDALLEDERFRAWTERSKRWTLPPMVDTKATPAEEVFSRADVKKA